MEKERQAGREKEWEGERKTRQRESQAQRLQDRGIIIE